MGIRRRRRRRRGRGGLPPQVKWVIALGVVCALLLGGYITWIASRPETGEQQQAVCALVIDRTGSSDDRKTVDAYLQAGRATVSGCRDRNALLSIYYFDQSSPKLMLAQADGSDKAEAFELWLPTGRKKSKQETQLENSMEDALATIEAVFAEPSGSDRGSDILTALDAAADNLRNQAARDGVDEAYLVILTDGIQLSTDVSVEVFTDESVEVTPLIDRARAVGLIPVGLADTQVSFVGVRSGEVNADGQLPQWLEAKVETFWRDLVTEAGGRVCVYGPATAAGNATRSDLPGIC